MSLDPMLMCQLADKRPVALDQGFFLGTRPTFEPQLSRKRFFT